MKASVLLIQLQRFVLIHSVNGTSVGPFWTRLTIVLSTLSCRNTENQLFHYSLLYPHHYSSAVCSISSSHERRLLDNVLSHIFWVPITLKTFSHLLSFLSLFSLIGFLKVSSVFSFKTNLAPGDVAGLCQILDIYHDAKHRKYMKLVRTPKFSSHIYN